MVDSAYKNAVAKRAALARQIERIDTFLDLYREFGGDDSVDDAPDQEATPARVPIPPVSGSDTVGVMAVDRAPRGTGAKMADAAEEALLAAAKPMPRADILKAIEAMGIVVGGKDPGATLGSALWRERERFVSIKGHGYWLKDRRYDRAGYDPVFEDVMGVTEDEPTDGTEASIAMEDERV